MCPSRVRALFGALCAAALALHSTTAASPLVFIADAASPARNTNLTAPLLACVGSSHAATSLWQIWRDHLSAARSDIGFQYVRFHGIFDDDMSTYLNGAVNMFNVFSTLDFLLSIGMRPIVELSFMPEELASNASQTVFHYKGGISAPANWTAWSNFITDFTSAIVARYGLAEVQRWRFEVFNEPNCGFYIEGNCCGTGCGDQTGYFQLYQHTANAVKSVSSTLKVGGPATAQVQWIPEFLAWTKANNVPVDFVSSHLYPTDPEVPTDRYGFYNTIAAAAQVVAAAGLPLVMTEFNSGLGLPGGQDSPYAAAFVAHQHLLFQNVSNVDTLSFWTFSDVFEEGGFVSQPYHEGFGMQTIYQVPKPVYRAFEMIAHQPRLALPLSVSGATETVITRPGSVSVGTVDVSVTVAAVDAKQTRVHALLVNYNTPDNAIAAQTVTVQVNNLPRAAPSTATLRIVDSTHAYAFPVWQAAGSPMYPNQTEVATELSASRVAPTSIALSASGSKASFTVTLQPQSVTTVEFIV